MLLKSTKNGFIEIERKEKIISLNGSGNREETNLYQSI